MAARRATRVTAEAAKKRWRRVFYAEALDAVVVGWLRSNPGTIDWIKAPGNGFIKPIKRVIAPVVLCTVVSGIAHIQDARTVGRIGVMALIHLEIVSTFALGLGPGRRKPGAFRRRIRRRHAQCGDEPVFAELRYS